LFLASSLIRHKTVEILNHGDLSLIAWRGDEWFEFTVDVGHYVNHAFDIWHFSRAILKNVEVCLDGIGMSSWFMVNYVFLTFDPKIYSLYTIRLNMPLAFLITMVSMVLIIVICKVLSMTRSVLKWC